MKFLTTTFLIAAGALALATTSASAAVVCNDEGECWHVRGHADYKPEFRLHGHPDNWRWRHTEHYRWREHEGHGYWRGGLWIGL